MKRSRPISTLLVLLVAMLLISSPALAWNPREVDPDSWGDDFDIGEVVKTLNAEDASADAAASPDSVPATAHPGFYAARDYRNIDAETYSLVGGHTIFYWDALEPNENDYQFWRIDDFVETCVAAGKRAAFGIVTFNSRQNEGNSSDPAMHVPNWVFTKGATTVVCPAGSGYTASFLIPEYWNTVYKTQYADFIDDLATYVESDPALRDNIEYIQIGVGKYGETQPCDTQDNSYVNAALTADGLSSYSWPSIVNAITDMYVNAFDYIRLLLPMSPRFGSESNRKLFVDHAIQNGVGLFPAGITTDQEWCDLRTYVTMGGTSWNGAGKYDRILDQAETGYPLISQPQYSRVPVSFEMYEYMTSTPVEFFWGTMAALSRRVDYITVERTALYNGTDPTDPITGNIAVMRWATPYMGVEIDSSASNNTPSVWVALRETGMNEDAYSQKGNYNFGITQDDSVSGGNTVPVTYRTDYQIVSAAIHTDYGDDWTLFLNEDVETVDDDATLVQLKNPNTSPDPSEPVDSYPSRKGWIARRTDQSTGNRYMWFKIDDDFVYGGSNEVTFTVHYFDRGTDQWQLTYDSTSGAYKVAGTVTKTNSLQWKVAKFTVADARFSNSQTGSCDFRLDCMNDGNEYIHLVDVELGEGTENYQVSLTTANNGWNLISVPLTPSSASPASYLASIAGKYDIVQAFVDGGWVSYPDGGLTAITEGMGLWVHVTENCTLNVAGSAPSSTTIALDTGWNLIGWPSTSTRTVTTALAGIAGNYSVVYTYDSSDTSDPWKLYDPSAPSYVSDLSSFAPGHAYWIYVTAACNLVVPF